MGSVVDCDNLSFIDETSERITGEASDIQSRIKPTAFWSDGSVKWCLAKIAIQSASRTNRILRLQSGSSPEQEILVTVIEDQNIVVTSASAAFNWSKNAVFPSIDYGSEPLWQPGACHAQLTLDDGSPCDLQITDVTVLESDGLSLKLQVSGVYNINSDKRLNARFIFEVLPDAKLSLVCEVHNPHRAQHPGGIWDLGDPGSITFSDFSLAMKQNLHDSTTHLLPEPDGDWIIASQPMVLFQASSGGKYWDNPVHKNAKGVVCNNFRGYRLTSSEQHVTDGERASPTIRIESNGSAYTMQSPNFWQNFPKSIDIDTDQIALRLFPMHHGDTYEIQGGERKRHEVMFGFMPATNVSEVISTSKPFANVSVTAYKAAGVFKSFDDQLIYTKYDSLLTPSKDSSSGFYAKREQLDEYGWRNFGDIYADHEGVNHKDADRPYVSHYNNQYDAVYGFIRQYALSADYCWQPLFTDLANHIMDIDIYRTDEDRIEYNNGYFWHTDHFVEAEIATHRTYSATQIDSDGNPQQGGGPSAGHCYSTGLAYYYFMTGDEEAKNTVINLGNWIINYQEGSGTLLETAKKTLKEDTTNFIKTCKGTKVFKYKYPMNRETGNYLRTLMDCFDLTADSDWLKKVEEIITNTAGPQDDIDERDFESVEYTWFYVVYLQEVVRYLDLKRSLDQYDNNFYYAHRTLLHYATWMVENEHPYLHDPDKLLNPNATWVAQETRRVEVLYAAYKYAQKDRAKFLQRARYFRDYLVEELSRAETLHYARIQVLLLQNHGTSAFLDTDSLPHPGIRDVNLTDQDGCFHTPATHLKHISGRLISSLLKFRISNELRWLRTRAG